VSETKLNDMHARIDAMIADLAGWAIRAPLSPAARAVEVLHAADGCIKHRSPTESRYRKALEEIAEGVKCAGFGRCDMVSRCGACAAKAIARAALTPEEKK
jgi:hypothetical protein